jgi:hypothetical protein
MSGQKLEMSKSAAMAAVKAMGPRDYISVVAFDSEAQIVVPLQRVGESNRAAARISRLGPGGGTNLQPGMEEGYKALTRAQASVKHMIVLTDGQTMGEGYEALAAKMRKQGITTTGVAVGNDAARGLLANIATRGGGKFYFVDNPRAIPRIFLQEARRVARPLVYEDEKGFLPARTQPHELLQGVEGDLPPLTGFVMTTVKENPLVETPLVSPQHDSKNGTLLATWTYGLGRSVAWTSDVGQRWAKDWPAWENYDKVFSQMVRWSLRPAAAAATARDLALAAVHRGGGVPARRRQPPHSTPLAGHGRPTAELARQPLSRDARGDAARRTARTPTGPQGRGASEFAQQRQPEIRAGIPLGNRRNASRR